MKQVDLGGPKWPPEFFDEDRADSAEFGPTWGVVPLRDRVATRPGKAGSVTEGITAEE